ncbi:MAG: hypothetical protein JSS52_11330 [Proteobacteria bacterium]|nr:hypothetical protein [Pseudomonadota bacterium]
MLLLAAAGTASAVEDPRPTVDDMLVMSMRPEGRRVAVIRIAGDGTGDYTTFKAAVAAGAAAQSAALTAAGLTAGQVTPNFRVDYLVGPGVYTSAPGDWSGVIHPFAAFYATDTTPGATVLRWGVEPDGGLYWEGIDIVNVDNAGAFDPKYPIHLHADATSIITRCTLTNEAASSGGYPTPLGVDGDRRATLVVHDVTMTTGVYTNIHGPTGTLTPGMVTVFSDCTFTGGDLHWWALDDTDPSEMWAVGSTAHGVKMLGAATVLHSDPGNTLAVAPVHVATGGGALTTGTTDTRTDWPVPVGALSAGDRARYGM